MFDSKTQNHKTASNHLTWAFFGTSDFAAIILEELKKAELTPDLIVTTPDRPQGRKMIVSPSPVKVWATANNLPILQPEKLKDSDFIYKLKAISYSLFIVAAYGKIIPKEILELPTLGSFNVHPSILPKYRGPSPLQYQILNDEKEIGTSIIKMDEEIDHGPIVVQERLEDVNLPLSFKNLEKIAAGKSAEILEQLLAEFLRSPTSLPEPKEQDHQAASFTKMIEKEDGLIDLSADPYKNYLKYLAYEEWPGTYFFQEKTDKKVRLKIKEADYQNSQFIIKRVIPEGKKEMSYSDFLKGF